MKKHLFITIFFALLMQMKSQTSNRFDEMKTHFNESETVFEGYFLKRNQAFLTPKKQVFTLNDFKVTKMIKGSMPSDSIIKIETEEGEALDPETGIIHGGRNAHGNGMIPSAKAIYYLYPKNERGNNKLKRMIDITNPEKIIYSDIEPYNPQPYTKLTDFYADLTKITGKVYSVEKKSLNAEREVKNEIITLSYLQKTKNYNDLIAQKIKLASNSLNKSSLVNDLTLQITNGTINGQVFDFDINVQADNNSTYLDNVPVYISYNAAVFGSSVVAANNVTVTNGTPFNNSSYYPANSYIQDNSPNIFVFTMSAITSGAIRTNITTSYKFLARVKMKISNCGNVNTFLTNASIAINACLYTTTANGSNYQFYNSLNYNGSLANNVTICPPVIKDFTSPVNGGVNQILTIKGLKFGATKGNGQVKFRSADNFGHPYLKSLDYVDYISWNDTMIQIKMPSTIDTVNASFVNTPGSGNFKIVTNAGDSILSGTNLASKTFSVYYSIYNFLFTPQNKKLKANLFNSVQSTGGYIVRLDTSVGNDPQKVKCIKKAIKDWTCLTGVNIKLGIDTPLTAFGTSDKICNIYLADPSVMGGPNVVAETKCNANLVCGSTPPVRVINDFDIRINKAFLSKFFYDTIQSTLPAFKIDFLEVIYHEMGHGIGLMHVNDSSAMMYYRTLGNLSTSIPGNQRRRLIPYTSDVDGGNNQVSTSNSNITGQCTFQPMIQLTSGSCVVNGIKELLANNFNAVLYPNPTQNGKVYLSFETSEENSKPIIEIYDVVGKKLHSEVLINDVSKHFNHQLDISSFSNGVYLLNITVNGNKASFKLVKN